MSQLETMILHLDEFEAMRLCDLENLDQFSAGEKMGVSRGTIQRLLEKGRKKLIQSIIERKAVLIEENDFCTSKSPSCCTLNCVKIEE
jgi:uncharacterized protein